jgi:hypothetical protein
MTRKIVLNQDQIDQIRELNEQTCAGIAVPRSIADSKAFIFFAAFDGTNNDKDTVPRGELCTNVAQLWDQYHRLNDGSTMCKGNYYKGPGAPGTLSQSAWLPDRVKQQVIMTAEDAYHDLCNQAAAASDMTSVAVVLTSFSRGGASAAIFSQMLYERGLVNPATREAVIPPKQLAVVGGVIFDPVLTGVDTTLAYPPNVRNIVDLKALNEYRYLFPGGNYSNHPEATTKTFGVYGNHCDIGGGYDSGIAGLTLQTATNVLQQLGLPIDAVPPSRAYTPGQIAVHSEEYDNYGNKIWDVSNEDGFSFADVRHMADVGFPFGPDLSGQNRFLMYNGDVIY